MYFNNGVAASGRCEQLTMCNGGYQHEQQTIFDVAPGISHGDFYSVLGGEHERI